jgi:hypothetical protein
MVLKEFIQCPQEIQFKDLPALWASLVVIGLIACFIVVGLVIFIVIIFKTDLIGLETVMISDTNISDINLDKYDDLFDSKSDLKILKTKVPRSNIRPKDLIREDDKVIRKDLIRDLDLDLDLDQSNSDSKDPLESESDSDPLGPESDSESSSG